MRDNLRGQGKDVSKYSLDLDSDVTLTFQSVPWAVASWQLQVGSCKLAVASGQLQVGSCKLDSCGCCYCLRACPARGCLTLHRTVLGSGVVY